MSPFSRLNEARPLRVLANTIPVMMRPPANAPIMNWMTCPNEKAVSALTPSGP